MPLLRSRSGLCNWANSSKMRSACSGGMPTPVSRTWISTRRSSAAVRTALTDTPPSSVNLIALPTRLPTTRASLTRSVRSQMGRSERLDGQP